MQYMPKTYNDLYLSTRHVFKDHGIGAYSLEARIVTASAAEKTMDDFMRDLRLYASDDTEENLEALVKRRLAGEPVAYITGGWEFYGLPIEVTTDVLIPRVDTEVLADLAIKTLSGRKMDARVLDLCSGSGCIGCAIAYELPATRVVMVDISREALNVSRRNSLLNGLSPRVVCIEADAMADPPMMVGSFDLIVSNPPYIPTGDLPGLDSSVRDYEPVWALDGGEDGLEYYRAISKKWKVALREGGLLMFEVGAHQAEEVKKIMRVAGYRNVDSVFDTLGIERVIFGYQ